MDEARQREAFDLLWTHWQSDRRTDTLPDGLRPATRREGYGIQRWIAERAPAGIAGWKLAATSRDGQAHIGVDGPLAGRIPAGRVVSSGATVSLGNGLMRVAEAEFVFRLGRDIAPREKPYEVDEVMGAVAALHLGIELPDSRFEDYARAGAPQLLADAACARDFVLGPAAPDAWRSIDLSQHRVSGTVVGKYDRDGIGSNVLGDPRVALTWLANELIEIGDTLRAGAFVTTGTCLKPMDVEPGDGVVCDFGALGRVSVRLA